MKRFLSAFLALALTISMGCYGAGVRTQLPSGPRASDTGVSWFWGLTSTNTNAYCETGLASVKTSIPFWGLIVSGITLGLITPINKRYACVRSAEVAPDTE